MSAYSNILGRAQNVASQPYTAYQGQLTAGLDPTQQAGISNVNSAYGVAQPYFDQAAQYAQQGAAPVANISGVDVERYYNPYQQNVINSTMANINESDQRQQQQVKGNAAMAGALGGDRQAVAQAELARQQGLARNQTLAGLQNQGYTQAQSMAQSQQQNQQANAQRAANAAYAYGQIGTGAQGAQLQGAGAQLGAGAVAQQNQQAALNAQYGQFQQQQAFPYQQLGWLAGVSAPIGGAMGGTQTTTPPSPNPFSQILGLGMAGLGAISKAHGGRVGYADGGSPFGGGAGGSPYGDIDYGRGYVPQVQISAAHPMQFTSVPYKSQPQSTSPSSSSISSAISGAKNLYGMMGAKETGLAGTEGFSGTAGGEAAPLGLTGSYEGANAGSGGFMSGISDMFSGAGAAPAAGESIAGAGEGLGALGAGAGESMAGLGAGAGEAMAGMGAGAGEALSSAAPAIAEGASEIAPVIAETAAEWGPVVGEALAEYGPMLLAFLKDGGRINKAPPRRRYADGGTPMDRGLDALITRQNRESIDWSPDNSGGLAQIIQDEKIRRGLYTPPPMSPEMIRAQGSLRFADGGFVDMVHSIRGAINGRLYAEGGDVETIDYDGGDWAPQQVPPQAMADWRGAANLTAADVGAPNAPVSPAVAMPQQGLPPEITAGMSRPGPQMPPDAMAYGQQAPMAPPVRGDQQPPKEGILGFLDSLRPTLSPEQKAGLMSFGLATAAGTSPFGMSNIGAGGLEGMKAMAGVRKEEEIKRQHQVGADAEARKMMHELRQHGLEERKLAETQWQHRNKPVLTQDERGVPIMLNPLTGKRIGLPESEVSPPPAAAPERPSDAPKIPATPKPSEVMAKEDDGLPPNAQFVVDTSGTVVPPWRNPEVLEGLTKADSETVRAIAEGRAKFLPLQRNNAYNRYIMDKVREYDPQADETAFSRRQRTSNFFAVGTAGGGGQNIAAMNTFGQHAKELNDLADQMDMGRFPSWNALKASLIQQGVGPKEAQEKIGKWQTASKAVADEGAKVFAGSQSALADREAWHKLFDVSNPKGVTKAKLQEIVKLIDGRLNSLAAQYNDGMRTNHAPPEFIKPRTREIFDQIRGSKAPAGLEGGSATGAAGAKPDAAARFKQLMQGGASEDDAYKTLKKEGYGG